MQAPITITASMACWVSKGYSQRDLYSALEKGDRIAAINAVSIYGPAEREEFSDFIRVGEAEVTVRLIPKDDQTRLMVQALQDQLTEERSKWHQRQEAILAEISKLQSLTFEPAREAVEA